MPFTIYKITNQVNGKIYIGQTIKSCYKRFREHIYTANYLNERKIKNLPYFYKAIIKYGEMSFVVEPLCSCVSKTDVDFMENKFIVELDSINPKIGYNSTLGGEGVVGRVVSDQTKKKQSEYAKNRPAEHRKKIGLARVENHKNGIYWHLTDPEYRRRISERQIGKLNHRYGVKMSEEDKKWRSEMMKGEKNPFYGKKHSPETIEKMLKNRGRSFKGKMNPAALRIEVDGIEFDTKREAMDYFGVGYGVIQRWLREGRAKLLGKHELI